MAPVEKPNYRLEDKKKVIEYFENNQNNTLKEIMKATGFSINFVSTVLNRHFKQKTIKTKVNEKR